MTKWSAVPFDETQVDSTTETVTLQGGNSNQRIRYSIPELGQSVVPVHKISDIPLVNGFRQFEQDKVYRFVEEISTSESLLVPAGWNGYIVGMHNSLTKFDYTGTGIALRTLNKTLGIQAISTADGGTKITVTTALPNHGLLAGQFINITGTTSYNQQKALISSVTDIITIIVDIPFVSVESSGNINTGYDAINIMNMPFTNADTAEWLDVEAAEISSIFRYNNIKAKGFTNLGGIIGGRIIGYDGDFDTTLGGLTFGNIDKGIVSTTTITQTNALATGERLLILSGLLTRDITLDKMQFNVADSSQFPMRIPDNLTIAEISIINSKDNNIAIDFFDTGLNGLDQTDPKVFAFNNGVRPNSSTQSESRSDVVLIVNGDAVQNIAVPIEDLTPVPGDFVLASISQEFSIDTSTGLITYNGLSSKDVIISYSLEATQTTGSAQDLIFDLRINGVQQAKTIRTITTGMAGAFVFIASIGGLFTINPGDTFKLFKNNTSNTNDTTIQNTILLIR